MMDNHIYNIIKAAIKRSESVWKNSQYLEDSQGCEECRALWEKLKQLDQQGLDEIKRVLENHAKSGMLR